MCPSETIAKRREQEEVCDLAIDNIRWKAVQMPHRSLKTWTHVGAYYYDGFRPVNVVLGIGKKTAASVVQSWLR